MKRKKTRIKTLNKFFALCRETKAKQKLLTVQEIMETIDCCNSHAYNYLAALDELFSSILS
jgi:hypothetical protein